MIKLKHRKIDTSSTYVKNDQEIVSYKLYESLQIKIYLTLDLDRSNQVNKVNFSHFHLKCLIPHLTSTHAGPTIEMWKNQSKIQPPGTDTFSTTYF